MKLHQKYKQLESIRLRGITHPQKSKHVLAFVKPSLHTPVCTHLYKHDMKIKMGWFRRKRALCRRARGTGTGKGSQTVWEHAVLENQNEVIISYKTNKTTTHRFFLRKKKLRGASWLLENTQLWGSWVDLFSNYEGSSKSLVPIRQDLQILTWLPKGTRGALEPRSDLWRDGGPRAWGGRLWAMEEERAWVTEHTAAALVCWPIMMTSRRGLVPN